jgi:hypothetical protein
MPPMRATWTVSWEGWPLDCGGGVLPARLVLTPLLVYWHCAGGGACAKLNNKTCTLGKQCKLGLDCESGECAATYRCTCPAGRYPAGPFCTSTAPLPPVQPPAAPPPQALPPGIAPGVINAPVVVIGPPPVRWGCTHVGPELLCVRWRAPHTSCCLCPHSQLCVACMPTGWQRLSARRDSARGDTTWSHCTTSGDPAACSNLTWREPAWRESTWRESTCHTCGLMPAHPPSPRC